jgi:hypothetical protein
MMLKVYLFVIPLEVLSFEYFIKFVYRIDYMDKSISKHTRSLKKVLVTDFNSSESFEGIFDKGIFMNFIKKKKKLQGYELGIWKDIQYLKRDETMDLERLLDETRVPMTSGNSNPFYSMNNPRGNIGAGGDGLGRQKEPSSRNHSRKNSRDPESFMSLRNEGSFRNRLDELRENDGLRYESYLADQSEFSEDDKLNSSSGGDISVAIKLQHVVVNSYVEANRKLAYSHLIRIFWMLKNRTIVNIVFRDIREMFDLATSLKNRFLIFYALKEVEVYFKELYTNPERVNTKMTSHDLNRRFTDQDTSNTSGKDAGILDVGYAFYHKNTIKYIRQLISTFAHRNSVIMEDLHIGSPNCGILHSKVKNLYQLSATITAAFEKYHNTSKPTEINHILPYCTHLGYNINLIRSGKNYLAEYMKRTLLYKRVHEEKNPVFLNENMLIDTVVCLVDSDISSVGNIIDVYGDSKALLFCTSKALIGKSPNYLLNPTLASFHTKIMHHFLKNPLRYFLGAQRDSFIKIPETNFILSSHLIIKIAPNIESGFRILVGIRPNLKKYNQKIIVNSGFCVDCYSYNFLTVVGEDYLTPGMPLEVLSPPLYDFVHQQIIELDKFQYDISRAKENMILTQRLNKLLNYENDDGKYDMRREDTARSRAATRGLLNANNMKRFGEGQTKHLRTHNQTNTNAEEFSQEYFRLDFVHKQTQNVISKYFEVSLEVKEFIEVGKRMYYLDMTQIEDSIGIASENIMKLQKINSSKSPTVQIMKSPEQIMYERDMLGEGAKSNRGSVSSLSLNGSDSDKESHHIHRNKKQKKKTYELNHVNIRSVNELGRDKTPGRDKRAIKQFPNIGVMNIRDDEENFEANQLEELTISHSKQLTDKYRTNSYHFPLSKTPQSTHISENRIDSSSIPTIEKRNNLIPINQDTPPKISVLEPLKELQPSEQEVLTQQLGVGIIRSVLKGEDMADQRMKMNRQFFTDFPLSTTPYKGLIIRPNYIADTLQVGEGMDGLGIESSRIVNKDMPLSGIDSAARSSEKEVHPGRVSGGAGRI